jgi:hypothetical protein
MLFLEHPGRNGTSMSIVLIAKAKSVLIKQLSVRNVVQEFVTIASKRKGLFLRKNYVDHAIQNHSFFYELR